MSDPLAEGRRGGSGATAVLAAFAMVLFGLVGDLPLLLGPILAIVGVVLSGLWRRWARPDVDLAPVPALFALGALALTSPPVPSAELFGGLATVAVLLWLADDPSRPAGGGRRAATALASGALAVGIAWSFALVLPGRIPGVGVAGGLLALVLLLLAYLLVRETADRPVAGARV
jgi:hypothetical protein